MDRDKILASLREKDSRLRHITSIEGTGRGFDSRGAGGPP